MELILKRTEFTNSTTIGELFVNGKWECFILEDIDRGLSCLQSLDQIRKNKVHGRTAIPYGRYKVILSFSNRFNKYLPEVLEVPGFAGIRIHSGNSADDTEGCLLPGQMKSPNYVSASREAFYALNEKLQSVERTEKIYLTIER